MAGIKKETEGADIWDSNCAVVEVNNESPSAIFVDTVPITTPPTTAMPTTTIKSSAGQTTTTMSPTSGQTTTVSRTTVSRTTTVSRATTTTTSRPTIKTPSTKKSGSNKMSAGQSVLIIAAEVMALGFGLWFK